MALVSGLRGSPTRPQRYGVMGLRADTANELRWALRRVEPSVDVVGAGPTLQTTMEPDLLAALVEHQGGTLRKHARGRLGWSRWLSAGGGAPQLAALVFLTALVPIQGSVVQQLAIAFIPIWLGIRGLRQLWARRWPGSVQTTAAVGVAAALLVNVLMVLGAAPLSDPGQALGLLAMAVAGLSLDDRARFRDLPVLAGVLVFGVLAAFVCVLWLPRGPPSSAFFYGAAVLVLISSPALLLAAPLSEAAGLVRAASCGIVFQRRELLWRVAGVGRLRLPRLGVLDDTAASVSAVEVAEGFNARDLLRLAAGLERASEQHELGPIGREAVERALEIPSFDEPERHANGVCAVLEGEEIALGGVRYIAAIGMVNPMATRAAEYTREGHLVRMLAVNRHVVGLIALAEAPRVDAAAAVRRVQALGVALELVSEGELDAADRLGENLGISRVVDRWDAPPEMRHTGANAVLTHQGLGAEPAADVMFVALKRFEREPFSSDCVRLLGEPLRGIADAVAIGQRVRATARGNTAIGLVYGLVLVPLAGGMFSDSGVWLDPRVTLAATALSVLSVALASARLRVIDLAHETGGTS